MDRQTCDTCGAVFRVDVPRQAGHEESEEYYCPECNREYRVRASNSPTVTLITPRTDKKGMAASLFETIKAHIESGNAVIMVDGKGEDKTTKEMLSLAKENGRDMDCLVLDFESKQK